MHTVQFTHCAPWKQSGRRMQLRAQQGVHARGHGGAHGAARDSVAQPVRAKVDARDHGGGNEEEHGGPGVRRGPQEVQADGSHGGLRRVTWSGAVVRAMLSRSSW
jgi:hypothetical protein